MIDAKALKEANERIKKIDFKGKGYALVASRVDAFRAICPGGSITCEVVDLTDGAIICKATVTDENGIVLSTGLAREVEGASYINKTSFVENCETSAVGRALGFLGIGSDENMASAEELANAVLNQEEQKLKEKNTKKITSKEADNLAKILTDNQREWALKTYKVNDIKDLNGSQYADLLRRLNEVKNEG